MQRVFLAALTGAALLALMPSGVWAASDHTTTPGHKTVDAVDDRSDSDCDDARAACKSSGSESDCGTMQQACHASSGRPNLGSSGQDGVDTSSSRESPTRASTGKHKGWDGTVKGSSK